MVGHQNSYGKIENYRWFTKRPWNSFGVLAGDFKDIAISGTSIIENKLLILRQEKETSAITFTNVNTEPQTDKPDLSKQLSLPLAASLEETQLIVEGIF